MKNTEYRKDLLAISALLLLLVALFSKILFTTLMVRAPDISSEFIWTVRHFKEMPIWDLFRIQLHPAWDWLTNGGTTEGGGTISLQFLYYRSLLFWLLPLPTSIAWFMVLHLCAGGVGVYCYCRLLGLSSLASFGGALIFALAPEQASLINAGHVQKIATISFAPWAFFCLEKGFRSRRLFWFLATALVLAVQFFNMHWQIAYYTCLALGIYGVLRFLTEFGPLKRVAWLGLLNIVMVLFFLSSVAISLIPLADWSRETTRGVQSGANQGKGGLQVDEAMAWSLPPEEVASFIVPGLFGFSRQESADDASGSQAYYWGRMVFTQTSDYMGLLPWVLLPLLLIFRRDRYVWIMLVLVVSSILFSMGRYTPFYWWLYEHVPGINHFRVPKMMMFVATFGLAVLTGLGLQLVQDAGNSVTIGFQKYLRWMWAGILLLILILGGFLATGTAGLSLFTPLILQPNRFASGLALVQQRWDTILVELGLASIFAVLYGLVIWALVRGRITGYFATLLLMAILVADVSRVNSKFLVLQEMPASVQSKPTAAMLFLKGKLDGGYRVLVLDGTDPMQYVTHGLPVMYTSNPVQVQRWQDFLDLFKLDSSLPDMMNVKYLVYPADLFERDRTRLEPHYVPVFRSPDGKQLVLENSRVMPKAWLTSRFEVVSGPEDRLKRLQSTDFKPAEMALVEKQPLLAQQERHDVSSNQVRLMRLSPNELDFSVACRTNSLLVLGEKYDKGWKAIIDGKTAEIVPVDHILRGVYLAPGRHTVVFRFDPLPFKIGKWLTLGSFGLFIVVAAREWRVRRKRYAE